LALFFCGGGGGGGGDIMLREFDALQTMLRLSSLALNGSVEFFVGNSIVSNGSS